MLKINFKNKKIYIILIYFQIKIKHAWLKRGKNKKMYSEIDFLMWEGGIFFIIRIRVQVVLKINQVPVVLDVI